MPRIAQHIARDALLDDAAVGEDHEPRCERLHEFVVVRAADAESLPTAADGAVDEEQIEAADQIGEIEDIEPKAKESVTFDLDPGDYVLFCNVVDDETDPPISHFQKGMSAQFTVSQ